MTPEVRVLRGAPDDVELAALVAGIAAGALVLDGSAAGPGVGRSGSAARRWRDAAQGLHDPLTPGPDAWRWSG
jgi:hypothetical protein